jgi:general secretion pathway protein J
MEARQPVFLTVLRAARQRHLRGFTLIEMLLAITIFSLVIGVIFSSFRLGSSAWEKGERDLELYQEIRAVTDLLYREIRSCFPYTLTPGELDKHVKFYAFFGEPHALKFVSSANLYNTLHGLSYLEFWVKDGSGLMAGEDLALGEDLAERALRDKDRAVVVGPEVKQIQFRYFDQKKKDEKGEWVQSWDPKTKVDRELRLPRAVEVSLTFDMGNGRVFNQEIIIPIGLDTIASMYNYGI